MNNNLQNIYTYLIGNKKHKGKRWYNDYTSFIKDVENIRLTLNEGRTLDDKECYEKINFKDEKDKEDPKKSFLMKLLYEQNNGIASKGQSTVKRTSKGSTFEEVLMTDDDEFLEIISNLIKFPNFENHKALRIKWNKKFEGRNNPVLTNRATAACTTKVSSTVVERKLNQICNLLQKEKFIQEYSGEDDWYHKNIFVIEEVGKVIDEKDPCWISIFIWTMCEHLSNYGNLSNPFSLKKQIVKYGTPGTGKTYIAKQTARAEFKTWKLEFAPNEEGLAPEEKNFTYDKMSEVVQFHPSYSYEDFLEGLRPTEDGKLTLHNGLFKSFCKKAGRWEVDIANLDKDLDATKLTVKEVQDFTVEEVKKLKSSLSDKDDKYWDYIFNLNLEVYGSNKLLDVLPPYFLIIDEINRAELSRVFGELMYCLEYRGIEGAIKTQYAHLNDESTGMIKLGGGYQFFVPHNLYILATMNTIDRSVESFDYALRRRFRWEEVLPNYELLYYHLEEHNKEWLKLSQSLKNLNKEISDEPLLGKDYCIGHAYLWDLPYPKESGVNEVRGLIWEDSIKPLLEEYLRGTGRENDLLGLFSKAFGLD